MSLYIERATILTTIINIHVRVYTYYVHVYMYVHACVYPHAQLYNARIVGFLPSSLAATKYSPELTAAHWESLGPCYRQRFLSERTVGRPNAGNNGATRHRILLGRAGQTHRNCKEISVPSVRLARRSLLAQHVRLCTARAHSTDA